LAALEYCIVNFGAPIPDEKREVEDEKYWFYVQVYRSDDDGSSLKNRHVKMEDRLDTLVKERGVLFKEQGKGFVTESIDPYFIPHTTN
jgi:hypothetical protein